MVRGYFSFYRKRVELTINQITMKAFRNIIMTAALGLICSSFTEQGRWIIDPESRLSIHGSTNVNSFKCLLRQYENNDTLEYIRNAESIEMKFTRNRMRIPVKGFSCGSQQITKDFLATLKSDTYPHLEIFFRSFREGHIRDNSYVDGVVDITLAGATKRYTVRYFARVPNRNTIHLKGTQMVNFGDFKLSPPQKMMGLIQVQECLEVEFNLTLKSI
jgi:hypothetical protein